MLTKLNLKAASQFASESNNLVNKAMGAGVMKELGSITSAASQYSKLSETVKPFGYKVPNLGKY
jgi:hypothetical protein